MTIGSTFVSYGTFTITAQGTRQHDIPESMQIDVSPQLINNWTYIPVRAFGETLGARVDWVPDTSTAYIDIYADELGDPYENGDNDEDSENDEDNNEDEDDIDPKDLPDNYGDFSNTYAFRVMSSEAVRNMYQDSNNRPFVFVLYDSTLHSSKLLVPDIQDAAQQADYRIYGVDMSDPENDEEDNEWLWSFFREGNFEDPTMYYVYSRSEVEEVVEPEGVDDIEEALTRFAAQAETEYEFGDFKDTTHFKTKSDSFIEDEFNRGNEFIVVLYDSTDEDSKFFIPFIKAAVKEEEHTVYGLDIDDNSRFWDNVSFMEDYRYDATGELPLVFLVYEDEDAIQAYSQPESVSRMISYINEFEQNAQNGTSASRYADIDKPRFNNEEIAEIEDMYDDGDEFAFVLYNSADAGSEKLVKDIAEYINDEADDSNFFYGINESSTQYSENSDKSNYDFLSDDFIDNLASGRPIIIYVNSKGYKTSNVITSLSQAKEFLDTYM
jgi:hypothetical protein